MTLTDLIAALEAADGPSSELDFQIATCLLHAQRFRDAKVVYDDNGEPWFIQVANGMTTTSIEAYTRSIDAALTLVPEGCVWDAGKDTTGPGFARIHRGKETSRETWFAATPAIALCIAALKAREAIRKNVGEVEG